VPQARCFAVAMLARFRGDAATNALRSVLRGHPLKSLDPLYAESEYVVKSDALEALCQRAYPQRVNDIAWGVHERLRAAIAEAGTHRLADLASALVDLLDDDVLAEAAADSLARLGGAAAVISPRVDAWLVESEWSARRRLALLRALQVLHRVHARLDASVAQHVAIAGHPALRAAAALLDWPDRHAAATIAALLRGAIGCDRELAADCRAALDVAGAALIEPARRALARNAEPDIYGELRPLSIEQRDWLTRQLHA
ncbi:MAG: hypothetical protein ACREPF_12530, partial [Rhodanobacteraceae bacterium]